MLTKVSASILSNLAGQKEKRKNDQNPDIKVSEELAPLNQEPSGRGALQGSTMEIGNQREQNPSACYPSSFIDLQLWESSKLYNQKKLIDISLSKARDDVTLKSYEMSLNNGLIKNLK